MAMSIAGFAPKKHLYAYISLVVLWILFEVLSSLNVSPLWYLFTFPITSLAGSVIAYYTFKLNQSYAESTPE